MKTRNDEFPLAHWLSIAQITRGYSAHLELSENRATPSYHPYFWLGFSLTNHPASGVPPFVEPPRLCWIRESWRQSWLVGPGAVKGGWWYLYLQIMEKPCGNKENHEKRWEGNVMKLYYENLPTLTHWFIFPTIWCDWILRSLPRFPTQITSEAPEKRPVAARLVASWLKCWPWTSLPDEVSMGTSDQTMTFNWGID